MGLRFELILLVLALVGFELADGFSLSASAQSLESRLSTLQETYRKNPADKQTAAMLGRTLLEASKKQEALKVLEDLAERFPCDAESHFLYGEALFRSKKHNEASIELKRAYNLDSSRSNYAVRAAEAMQAAKKFDELCEFASNALSKNPDPASKLTLEWLLKCGQSRDDGIVRAPKAKGAA